MAKVSYASLKLKTNTEVKTFDFNGNKIEVLQYLPIEDKIDLIDIALQKSESPYGYDMNKIDAYFNLHIVYLYSNLSFTDKQKEDELKLYDTLLSNGLLDKIIENMSEEEYNQLYNYMKEKVEVNLNFYSSLRKVLSDFLLELPQAAQQAADIMGEINNTPIQNVIDFAKAISNGKTE